MKDNEIGEHVECRRKVKKHNLCLDSLKEKRIHLQRRHNPGHLAPELTSFGGKIKVDVWTFGCNN
jgi:hypothetical protein